jgi:aminoglycoside 6-adenylyltransferase
MHMQTVHAELEKMVEWRIGINSGFSISTGMWGKHFKKHLPSGLYDMYTKTYPDSNYDNMWTAICIACDLFHILALSVADHFGFAYCQEEEDGMRGYLRMMQEIYAQGASE